MLQKPVVQQSAQGHVAEERLEKIEKEIREIATGLAIFRVKVENGRPMFADPTVQKLHRTVVKGLEEQERRLYELLKKCKS